MTVARLKTELTAREYFKWRIHYSNTPFGEYPANARNAHIVSTLANINRDPKKREKPFQLEEFMLFKPPAKKQEPSDEGARIAPETAAWFFAQAMKNGN